MNKTEWEQRMLSLTGLQKTPNKKFTGFKTEGASILYPESFVLSLNEKIPDFAITHVDYLISKNKTYHRETLHIEGVYENEVIRTVYEILKSEKDRLMRFSDYSKRVVENNPVVIAIGRESVSFFQNHSYIRFDILMHPYRKLYHDGDAKKIWTENL